MIYDSRNKIAQKFLETDAKWLLMIDDDIFPCIGRPAWMKSTVPSARNMPDAPLQRHVLQRLIGANKTTHVSVLAFRVNVPDASVLGSDQFPAPAAQTWRVVALALGQGLAALDTLKIWLMAAGGTLGIVLTLAPRWLPRYKEWIPLPTAFGLAWTFHWYYGLLFFTGGLIATILQRRNSSMAEEFTWPVASGVIAGGSLMGVGLVLWENGPAMFKQLLGG